MTPILDAFHFLIQLITSFFIDLFSCDTKTPSNMNFMTNESKRKSNEDRAVAYLGYGRQAVQVPWEPLEGVGGGRHSTGLSLTYATRLTFLMV